MRWRSALAPLALGLALGALAGGISVAQASSAPPLVYVCPASQTGTPPQCRNSQEFEVFDTFGNPIFSVPEFGGPAVLGDKLQVYAPGRPLLGPPSVVLAGETPQTYYQRSGQPATCVVPEVWYSQTGIWHCVAGAWELALGL